MELRGKYPHHASSQENNSNMKLRHAHIKPPHVTFSAYRNDVILNVMFPSAPTTWKHEEEKQDGERRGRVSGTGTKFIHCSRFPTPVLCGGISLGLLFITAVFSTQYHDEIWGILNRTVLHKLGTTDFILIDEFTYPSSVKLRYNFNFLWAVWFKKELHYQAIQTCHNYSSSVDIKVYIKT